MEGNDFLALVVYKPRWSICDHNKGFNCQRGVGGQSSSSGSFQRQVLVWQSECWDTLNTQYPDILCPSPLKNETTPFLAERDSLGPEMPLRFCSGLTSPTAAPSWPEAPAPASRHGQCAPGSLNTQPPCSRNAGGSLEPLLEMASQQMCL